MSKHTETRFEKMPLHERIAYAIRCWQANRATTYTPANILHDYGEDILRSLAREAAQEDLVKALRASRSAIVESANVIRATYSSFADNILGHHIKLIDAALKAEGKEG